MRDGCCVLDVTDFQPGCRESAHRRFTARSRAAYTYFYCSQSAFRGFVGRGEGRLLCGEWGSLARPAKAERAGARPGQCMTLLVGNGHDSVVESRLDVHNARMDNALLLLLEALLLSRFGFLLSFRHRIMSSTPLSSCWPQCRGEVPCACAHWCGFAGLAPADCGGAASRDRSPSRCAA